MSQDTVALRPSFSHALLLTVLFVWGAWAIDVSKGAVPGLLDDGTHLVQSEKYQTHGYFRTVKANLGGVLDRNRFYEVQYALLGLYNLLFGHDLALWYLSNFSLCLATALLIYVLVRMATGDSAGAVAASVVCLTASPLAEAARGNFGKAEVAMTFLFVLALTLLFASRPRNDDGTARRSRGFAATVSLSAFVALVLSAVAKESGRLFGLALVLAAVLGVLRHPHDRKELRWLMQLGVLGLVAGLASFLVFLPSRDNAYLKAYFALDFSPARLVEGSAFYASQNGDVILVAAAVAAWFLTQVREKQGADGLGPHWPLFAALYITSLLYVAAVLGTRFRVSYYLYVPAVLLAPVFGWAMSRARPRARVWFGVVAVATRLYSIPYNYIVAEAQRSYDQVNYRAMQRVMEVSPRRVISLDIPEVSQSIQEWNLLRWFAFDGRLAPLYGGPPFFESWIYQQNIRDLDPVTFDPARLHGVPGVDREIPGGAITPQPGDLVAVRSGTLEVGHLHLRGVLPQALDGRAHLEQIDGRALEWAGDVDVRPGESSLRRLGIGTFDYRWQFFRVLRRPRFLVLGRHADGWMMPEARVRVDPQPAGILTLRVEVPGWLPFSYPLRITASNEGRPIATLPVDAAGVHQFAIACETPGTLRLASDQWFQPSALGVSRDSRSLSYRVTKIDFAGPAGSAVGQRP